MQEQSQPVKKTRHSYQTYVKAGFDDDTIQNHLRPKLKAEMFSDEQINQYFAANSQKRLAATASGRPEEANQTVKDMLRLAITGRQRAFEEGHDITFLEALKYGFDSSISGIIRKKGAPPELTEDEAATLDWLDRIGMGLGQIVGDMPAYAAGGKGGSVAGAAIGSMAGPGGAAIGTAVGGAVGAFSFAEALRKTLINAYNQGDCKSWEELLELAQSSDTWQGVGEEAAKGAILGAATSFSGLAGKAAAGSKIAKGIITNPIAAKAAGTALPIGAETLGLTAAGGLIDGQVPAVQDFSDNALLMITMHGTGYVLGKSGGLAKAGITKAEDYAWKKADEIPLFHGLVNWFEKQLLEKGTSPAEEARKMQESPAYAAKAYGDIAEEQERLKWAYNEVKKHPEKGSFEGKEDNLAIMRPEGLVEYIMQRGASALEGDRIIFQGEELEKLTGTNRNFGMAKIVFKHRDVSVEDIQKIPEILRTYEPIASKDNRTRWRIELNDKKNYLLVTEPHNANQDTVITFFKEDKKKGQEYSYNKKGLNPPKGSLTPFRDTVRDVFAHAGNPGASAKVPPGSEAKKSIPHKNTNSNSEIKSRPVFIGKTQMAYPESKPEYSGGGIPPVRLSEITNRLAEATGIPVRQGKPFTGGKNVLGLYYPNEGHIRIRNPNDLAVVAHEIGHRLEHIMFNNIGSREAAAYRAELEPLATPGEPVAEGFAEFIAKYVVSPEEARAKAPKFYVFFEKQAAEKQPGIFKALQKAQEEARQYASQPAVDTVKSHISFSEEERPKKTIRQKVNEIKDVLIYECLDDLHPLLKLVRQAIKSGAIITEDANPYILSRLYKGWIGKAEAFLKHETFDYNGKDGTYRRTGDSFEAIMKEAEGKGSLEEFSTYLTARRVIELNDPAKIAPFTKQEAEALKSLEDRLKSGGQLGKLETQSLELLRKKKQAREQAEAARAEALKSYGQHIGRQTGIGLKEAKETEAALKGKYQETAQKLYKYEDLLLKMQAENGLLSKEAYTQLREMYPDYVPLKRVIGTEDFSKIMGSQTMASKQILKKLKGSTRDIINPLESILLRTYETIQACERNRINLAIADLAKQKNMGGIIFKLEKENGDPVKSSVNPNGEIKAFRDGKLEVYEMQEDFKDVARAINGLGHEQLPFAASWLKGAATMLRAGATTYNLAFCLKNYVRDSFFALISTRTAGLNTLNPLFRWKNLYEAIHEGDLYWKFKASGADMSGYFDQRRAALQNEFEILHQTGYWDKVWNCVKGREFAKAAKIGMFDPVLNAAAYFGEKSELATRLGEFRSSMKGKEFSRANIEAAGFNAREVTLDFAKAGSLARLVNQIVAFFNANIQGIAKNYEVLQRSTGSFIKANAILGGIGIAEALHSWDWEKWEEKEEVREISRAQRNINFIVSTGGRNIRIPKPQGVGIIATLYREAATSMLYAIKNKTNDREKEEIVYDLGRAFANEMEINLIPTGLNAPVEIMFNKSLFFDRPIVPMAAENELPECQYTDYTTDIAKDIGTLSARLLGPDNAAHAISPAKLEYFIRGLTGKVGSTALEAGDYLYKKAKGTKEPAKPDGTLEDIPFIRGFLIRFPNAHPESVERFERAYKHISPYLETLKKESKKGNESLAEYYEDYQAYSSMEDIKKQLDANRKQIKEVFADPDMTADQKRQEIDELYIERLGIAREGLEVYKETRNEIKKAREERLRKVKK